MAVLPTIPAKSNRLTHRVCILSSVRCQSIAHGRRAWQARPRPPHAATSERYSAVPMIHSFSAARCHNPGPIRLTRVFPGRQNARRGRSDQLHYQQSKRPSASEWSLVGTSRIQEADDRIKGYSSPRYTGPALQRITESLSENCCLISSTGPLPIISSTRDGVLPAFASQTQTSSRHAQGHPLRVCGVIESEACLPASVLAESLCSRSHKVTDVVGALLREWPAS